MEYKLSDASIFSKIDFYASTLDKAYYRDRPAFNGWPARNGASASQPKKRAAKKVLHKTR